MYNEKEVQERLHGAESNPDLRTIQSFSRKRSKGNGVFDRGNNLQRMEMESVHRVGEFPSVHTGLTTQAPKEGNGQTGRKGHLGPAGVQVLFCEW